MSLAISKSMRFLHIKLTLLSGFQLLIQPFLDSLCLLASGAFPFHNLPIQK